MQPVLRLLVQKGKARTTRRLGAGGWAFHLMAGSLWLSPETLEFGISQNLKKSPWGGGSPWSGRCWVKGSRPNPRRWKVYGIRRDTLACFPQFPNGAYFPKGEDKDFIFYFLNTKLEMSKLQNKGMILLLICVFVFVFLEKNIGKQLSIMSTRFLGPIYKSVTEISRDDLQF